MTIEIQLTIPEEGIVSKVADGAAKGRLVGLRLGEGTGRAVSEFVSGLFRASPASGSSVTFVPRADREAAKISLEPRGVR